MQVLKNQMIELIEGQKKVKVTKMGHIVEVMYMEKINKQPFPVQKIDKDRYMEKATGEIKEYKHTENRAQNKENLRRTFKKIRNLINNNFHGNKNELAFTITYADNMTDVERLYSDCDKFFKRLRYKYPNMDYLSVVEPQGRGAWHCHILLRFNDVKKIYIPNKEINEMWGNGFVTVKAIKKNVDNLGAYLSAYLGDIELNEDNMKMLKNEGMPTHDMLIKEVEDENGVKKKIIKGARLYLYPTGMNLFRKSSGIKYPESTYENYDDVQKNIVGSGTPNYTCNYEILDDDGAHVNTIIYEQYNLKRP